MVQQTMSELMRPSNVKRLSAK